MKLINKVIALAIVMLLQINIIQAQGPRGHRGPNPEHLKSELNAK